MSTFPGSVSHSSSSSSLASSSSSASSPSAVLSGPLSTSLLPPHQSEIVRSFHRDRARHATRAQPFSASASGTHSPPVTSSSFSTSSPASASTSVSASSTYYLPPTALVRILQARGRQIADGDAPATVLPPLEPERAPDPVHVAVVECLSGRVPFYMRDPRPDGTVGHVEIDDSRVQPFSQPVLVPSCLRRE